MWWRKSRKNSNIAFMHKNPGISHAELWIFLCKKVKIDRKMKKTGLLLIFIILILGITSIFAIPKIFNKPTEKVLTIEFTCGRL